MLMSIGYRFQQRLTADFIQQMNFIHDDDEFYQVSFFPQKISPDSRSLSTDWCENQLNVKVPPVFIVGSII